MARTRPEGSTLEAQRRHQDRSSDVSRTERLNHCSFKHSAEWILKQDPTEIVKDYQGFTVIELMVTVAVLGVALVVAIPSYNNLITNNRMVGELNEFVASLHFARSEAIKRGLNVSMCASADGVACADVAPWNQGWMIFVDTDGNGNCLNDDADFVCDGEGPILKVSPAIQGGDTLVGNANVADDITFDRNGFVNVGGFGNGTIKLCDANNTDHHARAVIISNTGRIRLETNADGRVCP